MALSLNSKSMLKILLSTLTIFIFLLSILSWTIFFLFVDLLLWKTNVDTYPRIGYKNTVGIMVGYKKNISHAILDLCDIYTQLYNSL